VLFFIIPSQGSLAFGRKAHRQLCQSIVAPRKTIGFFARDLRPIAMKAAEK
jgi:hypothetical protein